MADNADERKKEGFTHGDLVFPFPFQPYPQQLDLMYFVRKAVDQGLIAVAESPTGTGKTQCLLNSTLGWLADVLDDAAAKKDTTTTSTGTGGTTTTNDGEFFTVGDLRKQMCDVLSPLQRSIQLKRLKAKGTRGGGRGTSTAAVRKRGRTVSEEREMLDDSGEGTGRQGGYHSSSSSSDGGEQRRRRRPCAGALDEEDSDGDTSRVARFPKVFYTSRTHSQLSQSMEEAQRTVFAQRDDIVFLHVASRMQLCVNPKVRNASRGSSERLSELCIESLGQSCDSENGCPYADRNRLRIFKEHLRVKPRSLSQMRELGERNKACPYLAARDFIAEANVVFLPYGYLIDRSMREQLCGTAPLRSSVQPAVADSSPQMASSPNAEEREGFALDTGKITNMLQGSVVVVDEGHNLVDSATTALSAEIQSEQLENVANCVTTYYDKYESRLLGKNKQKLRELLVVLRKLAAFDPIKYARREGKQIETDPTAAAPTAPGPSSTTTGTALPRYVTLSLHDVSFGAEIDQFNFFALLTFIDDCDLRRKLRGFLQNKTQKALADLMTEGGSTPAAGTRTRRQGEEINKEAQRTLKAFGEDSNQIVAVLRFFEVFARSDADTCIVLATERGTRSTASPSVETMIDGLNYNFKIVSLRSGGAVGSLLSMCHSVVVAGGTLQPFSLLVNDLFPELPFVEEQPYSSSSSRRATAPPPMIGSSPVRIAAAPTSHHHQTHQSATGTSQSRAVKTLSLGHVVSADSIRLVTFEKGPSGVPFNFSFAKRETFAAQMAEVGKTLVNLCRIVPDGLVVFFPSYAAEELCVSTLSKPGGDMHRLSKLKKLHRESPGTAVEDTLKAFNDHLSLCRSSTGQNTGGGGEGLDGSNGAILFCVMGGKLSEGVNFNDHLARCVVVVGLPYPNPHDPQLRKKMEFLDGRVLPAGDTTAAAASSSTGRNDGSKYYQALCMRSVNQSIGRCIRHINDYATVVLLDERYATANVRSKLPRWMQPSVVNSTVFGDGFREVVSFFTRRKGK